MKLGLFSFAGLVSHVIGLAIPGEKVLPPLNTTIPEGYGHFATLVLADDDGVIEVLDQGYTGAPLLLEDSSPKLTLLGGPSPRRRTFTQVESVGFSENKDLSPLVRRDLCASVATCVRQSASDAVAGTLYYLNVGSTGCGRIYQLVKLYFTANNYLHLNAMMIGGVTGLIVNIISTPIGSAIQTRFMGRLSTILQTLAETTTVKF